MAVGNAHLDWVYLGLPPFSLQLKCAPEIGVLLPSLLLPHLDLRRTQRRRWRQVLLQDALIEQRHQFSRSNIIDLPQACYHPRCPGVHESTGQPDKSLPLDLFAQRGLTGAQHHQVSGQMQIVDVPQPQESIHRSSLSIDQREDNTGKGRSTAVEYSMSR